MSDTINGDLTQCVSVDTNSMQWTASPSGTVWRKRVHLVGPPEAGQVTSVVRYEPKATFPIHDHPDGEEILVLDGVFSDEHGDWPAGTYLLNPEGFRHRPFSEHGCLLLVKLRQYAGGERHHVALKTESVLWQPSSMPGVSEKLLYTQEGFTDITRLERWSPQTAGSSRCYEAGAEIFVLEGSFADEFGIYTKGCWRRMPVGFTHHPRSDEGCTFYIKTGGLQYLKSANT